METVLKISGLKKKFGNLTAVDDLNLEVEKGNVYGILGPNGSGKSTTLGIILNVIIPTAGNWEWFGGEPHGQAIQKVGATIEQPNFYPYLTGYRNLQVVARIKNASKQKVDEKLELVGLLDRKKDPFSSYSLGMKQRLAIASALLNDPSVLILDEPTNGLDPSGIIQIRNIINEVAERGTTILLASHLLDEVEKTCSHVIILQKGKTLYSGAVDSMNAQNGYFELKAPDMQKLIELCRSFSFFDKIEEQKGSVKAILSEKITPEALNQMFFDKGLVLSQLNFRKDSLESQFLQLTEKPQS